jgi:hypothetical protein
MNIVLSGGQEDGRKLTVDDNLQQLCVPAIYEVDITSYLADRETVYIPSMASVYTMTGGFRCYPDQTWRWVFEYKGEG